VIAAPRGQAAAEQIAASARIFRQAFRRRASSARRAGSVIGGRNSDGAGIADAGVTRSGLDEWLVGHRARKNSGCRKQNPLRW
jgi:hypothetical protein